MNDKTRAGLSSNARWSFRASFVKVIKTENSLYLINEDRQDIYLYDFFPLFLICNQLPKWVPQVTKHPDRYLLRDRILILFAIKCLIS